MNAPFPAGDRIPVYEPFWESEDTERVLDALRRGEISGSGGQDLDAFEREFAEYCGCAYGVATSSGTTALHLALAALEIGPGDEVIMPATTNIATALAVAYLGGVAVPVDVDAETWCLDPSLIEAAVTSRTRAILPVHLYGHPVDMGAIAALAGRYGLAVVEDAAEAHGARFQGHPVGGLGDVGCFSFYANKIVTTGEGGMLVTNRADVAQRAAMLRNLAFTVPRFRHEALGYNYRLTNLQAALGVGQVRRLEQLVAAKRDLAQRYLARLDGVPGLRLPVERPWARNVYWMFAVVVEPGFGMSRDALTARLAAHGIETRTMFCPMHYQPVLLERRVVRAAGRLPISEWLWESGFYLPSSPALTDDDLDRICEEIAACA